MKNTYNSTNLKDTVTTAAVIVAIFLATAGSAVASFDNRTTAKLETQTMDTIVISAQKMAVERMDTIVITAKR